MIVAAHDSGQPGAGAKRNNGHYPKDARDSSKAEEKGFVEAVDDTSPPLSSAPGDTHTRTHTYPPDACHPEYTNCRQGAENRDSFDSSGGARGHSSYESQLESPVTAECGELLLFTAGSQELYVVLFPSNQSGILWTHL